MSYRKIIESEYGDGENNFHIAKSGDTLKVELTYPPWRCDGNDHNQCRYIYINQESVRASDGIRVHYDYERDSFVVEQPKPTIEWLSENDRMVSVATGEEWIEVGVFESWRFNDWEGGCPPDAEVAAAKARYNKKHGSEPA